MSCDHETFRANVSVQRIADSAVWYADLTVTCEQCGQRMAFLGFPMGLSPGEPRISVDGTEARLPFRPYDEAETKRRFMDEESPGYKVEFGGGSGGGR